MALAAAVTMAVTVAAGAGALNGGPAAASAATAGFATTAGFAARAGRAAGRGETGRAERVPALRPACRPARRGDARCFALFARQQAVNAAIAAGVTGSAADPKGWGARDIESAYKLPVTRNKRQLVAVVEAYNTPDLAQSLAVYRKQYGLPPCTAAGKCLRVVNQAGQPSPLPPSAVPYGWDVETMLDASMVSAACPLCRILVVEARNDGFADMAAAEDTAARLGAQVLSNSYGAPEDGYVQIYAPAYDHPGHVIVEASGDNGFTSAQFPANLASVTAVGGTQLSRARNRRGWNEQVWNDSAGASGSGCSAYVAKPPWQHDGHCPGRTVADVSALAWNVAVYENVRGGWLTVGGTSAAAPLIAGVYGLAGNAATISPGYEYRHASSLFDITKGNNDWWYASDQCGGDYLCNAKKHYDAPSGLGTPDGIGAF